MKTLLIIFGLLFTFTSTALAECPMGKSDGDCSKRSGMCAKGGEEGSHSCPIMGKLMKKAHFLLDNSDAIGLSADQVTAIKGIKMQAKKSAIQQEAGMKIFMLDMESKLGEETLDVAGISAMIDKGSSEMASGGKQTVQLYAQLKAVLTPEQLAKAKEIWKKK